MGTLVAAAAVCCASVTGLVGYALDSVETMVDTANTGLSYTVSESPARRRAASATVATAVKIPNIIIVEREEIFPTDIGSGGRRASRRDRRLTPRGARIVPWREPPARRLTASATVATAVKTPSNRPNASACFPSA